MIQKRKSLVGITFTIGIILSFQNCGTKSNMEAVDTSVTINNCGSSDCSVGPDTLQIKIGNADPIMLLTSEFSFDVGGYCDDGGFVTTRIYYEIRGATAKGMTLGGGGCDARGRWRILVSLPGNFDHAQTHTVYVELKGVDSSGKEFKNPTGLSHREVSIASYVPPEI